MTSTTQAREQRWKYPAIIQNVELVCLMAAHILDEYPFQKKDRFAVELLLRESLNNALLHGCHQNPLLAFSCNLTVSNREVIIEVSDEGSGFDWRSKPKTLPEKSIETGRGLYIYAIYANLTKFNDAGNCVTLTRNICETPLANAQNSGQGDVND